MTHTPEPEESEAWNPNSDEQSMAAHMRMTKCLAACAGIPTDDLTPGRLAAQDTEIAALKAERDRLAEINRTLVKDFNTMMRANRRISEECDRLRPAVFEAHETFRSYAKLHESKGTPEEAEKAAANNRLGDRMLAALSPKQESSKAKREALHETITDADIGIED